MLGCPVYRAGSRSEATALCKAIFTQQARFRGTECEFHVWTRIANRRLELGNCVDSYSVAEREHPFHVLFSWEKRGSQWCPVVRTIEKLVDSPDETAKKGLPDGVWSFFIQGESLCYTKNRNFALLASFYMRPKHNDPRATLDAEFIPELLKTYVESQDKPIVVQPDVEYNNIIGESIAAQTVDYDEPAREQDDPVIEPQLYREFENAMSEMLEKRSETEHQYARHMGRSKIGTDFVTEYNACDITFRRFKRELTPMQWLKLHKGNIHTIAKLVPKPGTLTSNGKTRTVFAPTVSVEAFHRVFWNGVSPSVLPGFQTGIEPVDGEMKFAYDIKNCDEQSGVYFRHWSKNHFPELYDALNPVVIGKYGTAYRAQKLLSGVLHTSIVNSAYTYAKCRCLCKGRFIHKGDGFLTDQPVFDDSVRREVDFSLCGFKLHPKIQYLNIHKLVQPQFMRNVNKPNGNLRYFLRYYAAVKFGASVETLPIPKSIGELSIRSTPKEVGRYLESIRIEPEEGEMWRILLGRTDAEPRSNCELSYFRPQNQVNIRRFKKFVTKI